MPDPYLALHPNVKISPYTFQEYPKWVEAEGKRVLVNSAADEARVTGREVPVAQEPQVANALFAPHQAQEPAEETIGEKALLQLEASNMGIEVDRRWGIKKLRAVIEAAR